MNDDPGKAFATLRRLGAQPADGLDDSSFDIVDHLEKNLTADQSVEMIADHFSKISQEFPALCVSKLSNSVRKKLEESSSSKLPVVSRWAVQKVLKKAK